MSREGQRRHGSGDVDKGIERDGGVRPERTRVKEQGSSGQQRGASRQESAAEHACRERRAVEIAQQLQEERPERERHDAKQQQEERPERERHDARERNRTEEHQLCTRRSASRPCSWPRDERGRAAAHSEHARSRRGDEDLEGSRDHYGRAATHSEHARSRHREEDREGSRDKRGNAAAHSEHARSWDRDEDREGCREEQRRPPGASDSQRDSSLRTRSSSAHNAGSRHRRGETVARERRGSYREMDRSNRHGSARRPERRDQRFLSLPGPRSHARDDRRRDRSVSRDGEQRATCDRDHDRRGERNIGGDRSGAHDRGAPHMRHGGDRGKASPVNPKGRDARTSVHDRGCRAPSSTNRDRASQTLQGAEKRRGSKDNGASGRASGGASEGLHTSHLPRSGKEEDRAKEAPCAPAYDPSLDFFSAQFDALKALYNFSLQPPNPKVLPLDNISKCRAILPAELPESRAARMAINPKRRRSQAALEALARARARTATVRSRQEAAAAAARPPALQRVAAAVPDGPLSLLRRACNSREEKVRVVTRHRRGVRGVATGFLRGFDKYMNLLLWDADEHYTVRLRLERSKIVGVPVEDVEDTKGSPQQGKMKRGKMERSRLVWKQEKRRRHLQQVLLRGSSIVVISAVQLHLLPA